MNRSSSARMADMKGKGICYDDDDSPIQVTDQDDSPTIHDYRLSLIGKILNPKKQTVEKLIQTMSAQWGMQDRITANNLGNGKFLLNFLNEDDIKAVLCQGPFHYNFLSDGSRQFSLRDQKPYDKYGNYADLRVRTSRYEDGFMKDARRSQNNNDRKDGSSDQFRRFQPEHDRNYDKDTRKYSGNARKIALMSSRHGSRYAPYGTRLSQSWRIKERRNSREVEDVIEPYARTPQPALSEHSSTSKSDGVLGQEGHRSSGKRIASTIVTPV
ncbi:hypothetical protein DY000_02031953 [Brassica cretica]|uniref:DUF4283 domain-containing protein n=1 Tax=Brassica cretica TaxID=69181 RepID=A0ABQ7DNV5_BRACR|nr:hypothetical protein DY000_02031953 [Brassica cretica]